MCMRICPFFINLYVDERLLSLIANSEAITESVQRIVNEGQTPKEDQGEENGDDGDIFALANRVHQILQQIREANNKPQKR
jgi:hypothetical protein